MGSESVAISIMPSLSLSSNMLTHQSLHGHQSFIPHIPILMSHQLHHPRFPTKIRDCPATCQLDMETE